LLKKYAAQNQFPVIIDEEKIAELGVKLVSGEIMSAPELIRHDSDKLAMLLTKI